jgi:hypothetical protein
MACQWVLFRTWSSLILTFRSISQKKGLCILVNYFRKNVDKNYNMVTVWFDSLLPNADLCNLFQGSLHSSALPTELDH